MGGDKKETLMIIELLKMQKQLDKEIMSEYNLKYDELTEQQYFMAILDEIGEFIHARKKEWCWWKKTQEEVNEEHALEEVVDILHFVLSYSLMHNVESYERKEEYKELTKQKLIINLLYSNSQNILENYINFAKGYGYEIEQLYNAYLEKNKVNYERLKTGY